MALYKSLVLLLLLVSGIIIALYVVQSKHETDGFAVAITVLKYV